MPDKIITINHADNVVINTGEEKAATSWLSADEQFMKLVDKAYSCTVLYRKLLSSNENTVEKEMEVINQLHETISDIYFFYEGNSGHPKAAIALSLVDIYNEFLGQFKNFVNLRNAGNDSRKEADKLSAQFSALVDLLLNARRNKGT